MDKRIRILTKNLLDECEESLNSLHNAYINGVMAAVAAYMSEAYACTKVLHFITAAYEDNSSDSVFEKIDEFVDNMRVFNRDLLEDMSNNHSLSHMLGEIDSLKKLCQLAKEQL